MSRQARFSDERGQVHCATVYYDFDLDGDPGAETSNHLLLPGVIPAGAILINGIIHVLTSLAGAGNVGLDLFEAGADTAEAEEFVLVTAEAVANWDAGLKVTDLLAVVAGEGDYDPQLFAVDTQVGISHSGTMTAGRFALHLTYIMSPTEVPELVA